MESVGKQGGLGSGNSFDVSLEQSDIELGNGWL